jgi:hypothetical protein
MERLHCFLEPQFDKLGPFLGRNDSKSFASITAVPKKVELHGLSSNWLSTTPEKTRFCLLAADLGPSINRLPLPQVRIYQAELSAEPCTALPVSYRCLQFTIRSIWIT